MTATAPEAPPAPLGAYSGVEYVFEPNSKRLPPVKDYLAEVWERRAFIVALSKADVRGGRSRTVLGELWALMDPIFQAALYYLLIMMIRGGGDAGEHRLIILVSGIFLFRVATQIITKGARAVSANKGLVLNTTFPRMLLPLAEVHKALLGFVPMAIVYAAFHLIMGAKVGVGILMYPLILCLLVAISLGLGLVFATLIMYVRDMSNLLDYVMRLFFFGSPILWEVGALPDQILAIMRYNPLFAVFASSQAVVVGGVPSVGHLLEALFWAVLFLIVGFRLFASNERSFALRI